MSDLGRAREALRGKRIATRWVTVSLALATAACSSGKSGGTVEPSDAASDAASHADGAVTTDGATTDGPGQDSTVTGDAGLDSGPSVDATVDSAIDAAADSTIPTDTGTTAVDSESPDTGSTEPVDSGAFDTSTVGPADTGTVGPADSGTTGPTDTGTSSMDSGVDGGADAMLDAAQTDSSPPREAEADGPIEAAEASADTGTTAEAGTEAGSEAGAEAGSEAGADGGEDASTPVNCGATMAILAGNATTTFATSWDGSWGGIQTLTGGGGVASVPALVSNGAGFVGVVRESTTNDIEYTVSGSTWSALTGVSAGSATATTLGPPALAPVGGVVHLVYWGTDDKFYHGSYAAGSWTLADDPVGGAANQAFGPSAATAAGLTASFNVAQAGQDSNLYVLPWNSGWGTADAVASDAYNLTTPRIVTLDASTGSQMVVYSRDDNNDDEVLMYSILTGGTWSTPAVVHDTTVFTPNTVALSALPNGGAVLVYEGANNLGYSTLYTPGSSPTWSAPTALVASSNPTLASPPQIAPGVCGADAVAVIAPASGALEVTTLTGTTWSTPTAITGTSGSSYATIATQPCTSTMAVLGGGASSAFATTWDEGTWGTTQTLTGSVANMPSIVSNGSSYVGVLSESTTNDLDYTVSGATWSALAGVPAGSSTALTLGAPSLALVGTTVHLVYWGTDDKFYHGSFAAGSWSSASDPVGGSSNQAFGPSAPTAAGLSASFDIAQTGQDSNVYAESWSTTWGSPAQLASDGYNLTSPRIVTLTGGTASQMIVYSRDDNNNDQVLMYSVLTGATWSTPAAVYNATVFSPSTASLSPLSGGGALLVYQGGNGQGYYSIYTPGSAAPWSAPAALLTASTALAAPPQVAPGVCGAEAVVVYVPTGGSAAAVMTFSGGSWSSATSLPGTSGATYAAIATQP